ncbi:WD repeat-containing protein 91 homolog isoform X4 [Abrus precatorius]|uniref:WD repeat-containing protein 91 homolog isoform X4 n=1 Tax=Abrus precatorius TaxID=3816 RepID=A0A8B8M319_ABRPR|nr:WD repeat-containing protein 91 homolog isoform X4 [Abrus precatorius]
MEKMQYAEELVREFLVFRGFTNTLEAYEAELRTDIGKGFEVEKILDLIFSLYVPKFQADKLVALLGFFKRYLSSSETPLVSTLSKLETSLLRFYVVHALQCNRIDKVVEFFALSGTDLLQRSQDWSHWFAIPYIKNPHLDPDFRIFFSKEWYQALHLSARNFFSEVFNENDGEEDFAEVKVEHQETFLGHTSSISRCRFSASGNNIASASMDGTVRIWTYDTSTPVSRNATIYCGSEVLSLDWECKSDRLLLIGTADGCIKAWNVDAKRVVCDLNTTEAFPSVLDIKCSPVEPIFVSAAASGGAGSNYCDNLGFASLTVWNMKLWKAMTVLPLGEDPPAITSLCFNHNGKILAASAVDGMIHMFDMSSGLQITGWPAHDSSISSILFGPDETSIFSLGSDGKARTIYVNVIPACEMYCTLHTNWFFCQIFEWSLQNQGQILWSRDCSRFCYPFNGSKCSRHEMALDANGRRLLVTSSSVRAPIYQVQGHLSGWRTLPHGAHITTVDWHPTLPIFLTGSADNSVRVTSLS